MKKRIAVILILIGLGLMSVPFYFGYMGSLRSRQMKQEFQNIMEEREDGKEKGGQEKQKAAADKEDAGTLQEGEIIGLIEIEKLGIKYVILEGTGIMELSSGIGHIPDTAGIGEDGNCVLAGHRGSRYGEYFRHLDRIEIGDEIKITDREGKAYLYGAADIKVVGPYDNSVKRQGEEKEITLLTCENNGTKRLVITCIWKGE